MFLRISLLKDTAYTNQLPVYIKSGQVKIEWGANGRGRKRDREKQINRVRDSVGEICKRRGLRKGPLDKYT
jgi:hypothetical protein